MGAAKASYVGTGCFFKNLLELHILVFFKTYYYDKMLVMSYSEDDKWPLFFLQFSHFIAASSIASNFGVPKPVTGSQPLVHWKPYLEGYPVSSFELFPTVMSVKACGLE